MKVDKDDIFVVKFFPLFCCHLVLAAYNIRCLVVSMVLLTDSHLYLPAPTQYRYCSHVTPVTVAYRPGKKLPVSR